MGVFGNASGGELVNGKYDMTITSTPPCALPVFQNCSGRKFTTDAQRLICNPNAGQNYDCEYPSYTLCDSSSKDSTAGFLVVAAVVRMSQMLSLLWSTVNLSQGDMAGYITQIVVKFFQPQAQQKWQSIVTAVSSVVGLFTFVAVLIDGFTAGAATPALVAAIVGIQSALAAASNFALGFNAQKPDDTYLAIDGNYTQSVMDYARGLGATIDNIWKDTELGSSGIAAALASGAWLDVLNPFNVTGIAEEARDWLDNLLVTSYINRVFDDADAFITFIPYGSYAYSGVYGRGELYQLTQDDCANH